MHDDATKKNEAQPAEAPTGSERPQSCAVPDTEGICPMCGAAYSWEHAHQICPRCKIPQSCCN